MWKRKPKSPIIIPCSLLWQMIFIRALQPLSVGVCLRSLGNAAQFQTLNFHLCFLSFPLSCDSWPALRHTQAVSWAFCNIQSLQRMEELYCAEMQQVFPKLFYCTNVRVGLKYCSSTCLSFLIENSRWLLSCVRNVIIQFPLAAFGLSVKHVSNKEQKLQRLRKVPLVFFFLFRRRGKNDLDFNTDRKFDQLVRYSLNSEL